MLKIKQIKNGNYVLKDEQGNVVSKEYNNIETANKGFVARLDTKGTFLDCTYDVINANGDVLFSDVSKYDGNYVNDYNYSVQDKYVVEYFSSTPDYDNYDHETTSSKVYRHLDGDAFNIDSSFGYAWDMDIYSVKDNYALMRGKNGKVFIYDLKNKNVTFNYDKLTEPIDDMLNKMNVSINNKIKNLVSKTIFYNFMEYSKDPNLTSKDKENVKKELLQEIESYKGNEDRVGLMHLNGYVDKKYYKDGYDYDSPVAKLIINVNHDINKYQDLYVDSKGYLDFGSYRSDKGSMHIRLFSDTISNNIDEIAKKVEYNWDNYRGELGKYRDYKIAEIDNNGFKIKVSKQNVTVFKNIYEKTTGQKYDLDINKYCDECSIDVLNPEKTKHM